MKFPQKFQSVIEAPKQAIGISIIALIFAAIAMIISMSGKHGA